MRKPTQKQVIAGLSSTLAFTALWLMIAVLGCTQRESQVMKAEDKIRKHLRERELIADMVRTFRCTHQLSLEEQHSRLVERDRILREMSKLDERVDEPLTSSARIERRDREIERMVAIRVLEVLQPSLKPDDEFSEAARKLGGN